MQKLRAKAFLVRLTVCANVFLQGRGEIRSGDLDLARCSEKVQFSLCEFFAKMTGLWDESSPLD
jgi:hypothetical protein